jgi:hypothetical protein
MCYNDRTWIVISELKLAHLHRSFSWESPDRDEPD